MRAVRGGAHRLGLRPPAVAGLLAVLALSACDALQPPPLPVAFTPSPPPPVPPYRGEPQTRAAVRTEIIRWFNEKGYKPAQIYALVDYVRMESNFNTCITNGSSYKYLFQWNAERVARLARFTGMNTCPQVDKQLAYADHELRTNPNYSCFFSAPDRSAALTALRRGFGYGRC
jgi:hypothetical protein